jgi:hypothetical protein
MLILLGGCGFGGCGSRQKPARIGLTLEELRLTTVTVRGRWVEDDDPLPLRYNESEWSGSGFVAEVNGDMIRCLTNAHCLNLQRLAESDSWIDNVPDVVSYELEVFFTTGKRCKVVRIAEASHGLDAAWLEVSGEGLRQGRDFLVVPRGSEDALKIGTPVVAVGSPLGLSATHTFGRISALRKLDERAFGRECIQHDAPINPGNSGGPLFVESKSGYVCVGINTAKAHDGESLGFALSLNEALNGQYVWASADAEGAVKLLWINHKTQAVVSPK